MKLSGLSKRSALAVIASSTLALSMGACSRDYLFEGNGYSNPIRTAQIRELYEARDACLSKNAVPAQSANTDVASLTKAVALSCAPETDRLIAASNLDRDPKVAMAIRSDTDRKAAQFVLRAQR